MSSCKNVVSLSFSTLSLSTSLDQELLAKFVDGDGDNGDDGDFDMNWPRLTMDLAFRGDIGGRSQVVSSSDDVGMARLGSLRRCASRGSRELMDSELVLFPPRLVLERDLDVGWLSSSAGDADVLCFDCDLSSDFLRDFELLVDLLLAEVDRDLMEAFSSSLSFAEELLPRIFSKDGLLVGSMSSVVPEDALAFAFVFGLLDVVGIDVCSSVS